MKIRIVLMVILALLFGQAGYALTDSAVYNYALEAVQKKQLDFAFIHFQSLLRYSPSSSYYDKALFACGEYYFLSNNYPDAEKMFNDFIINYPQSKAFPFAAAYLIKINLNMQANGMVLDFKKKIVEFKQLSLVFREFKEFTYKSALGLKYKAVYFIDRVEFYINGELFETVNF